jgi:hypothetical protein
VLEVAHALELVLADDPTTARPVPSLSKLAAMTPLIGGSRD